MHFSAATRSNEDEIIFFCRALYSHSLFQVKLRVIVSCCGLLKCLINRLRKETNQNDFTLLPVAISISVKWPGVAQRADTLVQRDCATTDSRSINGALQTSYRPGYCAEGLVLLLSKDDEFRLDENEGVPAAYEKHLLPVEVYTASIDHVGRSVFDVTQQLEDQRADSAPTGSSTVKESSIVQTPNNCQQTVRQKQGVWQAISAVGRDKLKARERHSTNGQANVNDMKNTRIEIDSSTLTQGQLVRGQITKALVYTSSRFQKDSPPRDEYIMIE